MPDLSRPAELVRQSLEVHPEENNPYAIAIGPLGDSGLSTSDVERGLRELEAAGLAEPSFQGWRLLA